MSHVQVPWFGGVIRIKPTADMRWAEISRLVPRITIGPVCITWWGRDTLAKSASGPVPTSRQAPLLHDRRWQVEQMARLLQPDAPPPLGATAELPATPTTTAFAPAQSEPKGRPKQLSAPGAGRPPARMARKATAKKPPRIRSNAIVKLPKSPG